jgi:Kef-type K+ transport system membrane component KefB
VAIVSQHRAETKSMVTGTERPAMLPIALLAGALVQPKAPLVPILLSAGIGARLLMELIRGTLLVAFTKAARPAGPAVGFGMTSIGAFSLACAVTLSLRLPPELGPGVLAFAAGALIAGELLGPLMLRRALTRAGELVPGEAQTPPPPSVNPPSGDGGAMSGHGSASGKGFVTRVLQAAALGVTVALLFVATRATPEFEGPLATIAAVGFLLLAGTLMSELLETIGLPHLSGYLIAGLLGGPYVLHLVDHETVGQLGRVNTLALALIAIAGGAELKLDTLKSVARSVSWALFLQSVGGMFVVGTVFFLLARFIPFARDLEFLPLLGVAMLWGTLAVSRSPSALLGILSQTRAKGPVATFSLAFVLASDVVVVVMMAIVMMLARPLITPGGGISMRDFNVLGHELVGSVAMGTTLGLMLALYLKLVGKNLLVILLALGLGLSTFMKYVHIDPLLSFMTAGFVVQNLSDEGPKLLEAVEQVGSIVFVVFFATAGAHLDLALLQTLWPIALGLCTARAVVTFVAARLSSRIVGDVLAIRRWGFSSLISQAGFALGLGVIVAEAFPELGSGFGALAVACVAVNEMIGPILFKFALDRAGESHEREAAPRPSLAPPPA